MKKILFILVLSVFQFGYSQETDFLKLRKYKTAELSDSLRETSGLNFFKQKLYTFNDGGNTSEIFEIERTSGKILKVIKTNLQNKDWEAITSDSTHIYIGDFGNNLGSRKDLKIYKIPFKEDFITDSTKTVSFFYPEQTDFSPKNISNDFSER